MMGRMQSGLSSRISRSGITLGLNKKYFQHLLHDRHCSKVWEHINTLKRKNKKTKTKTEAGQEESSVLIDLHYIRYRFSDIFGER